ncbi:hypothetical protein KSS87_015974 [Heliosperma pusillum]|nr:hypothetical protein KSS87_015974 [Heliosperma pusillum]
MEHKGVSKSCLILSEVKDDSLCAMYFGISCAIFALKNVSEQSLKVHKCSDARDKMLLGSAHLLGLLVWRVQRCELSRKLESCEREIIELRRMRSEDAKANDKVASIYASQEQSWFIERRKLRNQIGTLLNDMRILDRRKTEAISELNGKLEKMDFSVKSKDKILEDVEKKRCELEGKVKSMEDALEELREITKREAEEHSSELLKQKTAFIELVSNQRQLEAELGRAIRQGEAAKEQLDYLFEEKEEAVLMVQELSVAIERIRKESEQKDKILFAMMRKSKLDGKLTKSRRNKDDSEIDRWRAVPESRHGRRTLRNMLSRQISSRFEVFPDAREDDYASARVSDVDQIKLDLNDDILDDFGADDRSQLEDYCLPYDKNEAIQLDEWIHLEAEMYRNAFEKRHQLELDSIAEQMHLKEDKLEVCRWRLLSAELQSKKLQSKIESLNKDLSKLRHDNLKLETLLVDREVELKTVQDQMSLHLNQLNAEKAKLRTSRSNVKLVKKNSFDKENAKKNIAELETRTEEKLQSVSKDSSSTFLSPAESIDEKETLQLLHSSSVEFSSLGGLKTGKEEAEKLCVNKRDGSTWKVDIHALSVSYKIKRLNQQLLMLDRLTGRQESSEIQENDDSENGRTKGFSLLLSLLNKQVSRYQSLQEKTDDLSKRMGEKELNLQQRGSNSKRTKEETRKLEHFLEETFQLQRIMVASGQKLIEIQSKIASGLDGISHEFKDSASFDMKRFADTIQSLFKDVQRGLEVRISKIIGDLGGTLTCDGIHFRK